MLECWRYQSGTRSALAKVATEAHRAVDSFYITRADAKVERAR